MCKRDGRGPYTLPTGNGGRTWCSSGRRGARRAARPRAPPSDGTVPWTLEQVIVLLAKGANALDVAHGKGVAHRDIKPANIFVLGETLRPCARGRSGFRPVVAKDDERQHPLKADDGPNGHEFTSLRLNTRARAIQPQFMAAPRAPWTELFELALWSRRDAEPASRAFSTARGSRAACVISGQ